ncbi:vesicle-associated membrane protein 8-like [Acanthopagrus latus]|uniref:vesicle-associated membrane protein 8-like n=1 Tax=Acanthopagrus latus TaxID=8177 RepID=UPI00187C9380|nr:vesicle-associated membrane protein 8-like [Acanthopagrus latus]
MEPAGVDSEPAPQSRMQELNHQIDEVVDTMKRNVIQISQRGDNLVKLENKTEKMEEGAKLFKKTSQTVARSYWWKNAKLIVVIVVVVLIVVLIIVLLATGVIPTSAPRTPIAPLTTATP